jgi:chromosome segregation ATPase
MEGKGLRTKNESRNQLIQSKLSLDDLLIKVCDSILQMEGFTSYNENTITMQNHILSTIKKYQNSINFETEKEYLSLKRQKEELEKKIEKLKEEIEDQDQNLSLKGSLFTKIIFDYETMLNEIPNLSQIEEVTKYFDILSELKTLLQSILKVTKKWNKQFTQFDSFISNHILETKDLLKTIKKKQRRPLNFKDLLSAKEHIQNEIKSIKSKNEILQSSQPEEVQENEENETEDTERMEEGSKAKIYALDILKRIQSKLDSKSSVEGQVNSVIQESMSLENLSMMFEGWMPWI